MKLNGETEAGEFPVDAVTFRFDEHWVYFNDTTTDNVTSTVAAFPTKRVIAILLDDGDTA